MPQPLRCCSQHLMVGVIFFLTCSPILDLGHFSQVILPIVLQIMPQLSGAVHSIWWLGFFFLTCSPILDLGHFSQVILPIVLQIMPQPTIRCCEEHLMVGVIFFLTCSPILDLGHFSQVILPIVLTPPIMPQLSGAVHSIWWLVVFFFFDLFSHSGLRAFFTSDFANCTTDYAPTIRCCPQHLMVGVIFACSPILDLGHFWQVILPIVLLIMPQVRCCEQHLMVGVNFFWPVLPFWT